MKVYFNLLVSALLIVSSICFSNAQINENEDVTPLVYILEENPPKNSKRVVVSENKEVTIHGILGENIVMECVVFNKLPQANIIWRRTVASTGENEPISNNYKSRDQSKYRVGQGKEVISVRLEILALSNAYEGNYTCECQYSGSTKPARDIRRLLVFRPPVVDMRYTTFSKQVKEGERVELKCVFEGKPVPSILWTRVGGVNSVIRGYGITKAGEDVVLESVEPSDSGLYICTATNDFGSLTWQINLQIRHQPVISIYPAPIENKIQARVGCNLELLCSVTAYPAAAQRTVSWTGGGIGTPANEKRIVSKHLAVADESFYYSLSFEPVKKEDFDKSYSCSGSNSLGDGSMSITLVEGQVETLGRGGILVCYGCGLEPSSIFCTILIVLVIIVMHF